MRMGENREEVEKLVNIAVSTKKASLRCFSLSMLHATLQAAISPGDERMRVSRIHQVDINQLIEKCSADLGDGDADPATAVAMESFSEFRHSADPPPHDLQLDNNMKCRSGRRLQDVALHWVLTSRMT